MFIFAYYFLHSISLPTSFTYFKKCKDSNVFTGCAVSYDLSIIDDWCEKGCQFFSIGCDRDFISSMSKDIVNKIRSLN